MSDNILEKSLHVACRLLESIVKSGASRHVVSSASCALLQVIVGDKSLAAKRLLEHEELVGCAEMHLGPDASLSHVASVLKSTGYGNLASRLNTENKSRRSAAHPLPGNLVNQLDAALEYCSKQSGNARWKHGCENDNAYVGEFDEWYPSDAYYRSDGWLDYPACGYYGNDKSCGWIDYSDETDVDTTHIVPAPRVLKLSLDNLILHDDASAEFDPWLHAKLPTSRPNDMQDECVPDSSWSNYVQSSEECNNVLAYLVNADVAVSTSSVGKSAVDGVTVGTFESPTDEHSASVFECVLQDDRSTNSLHVENAMQCASSVVDSVGSLESPSAVRVSAFQLRLNEINKQSEMDIKASLDKAFADANI